MGLFKWKRRRKAETKEQEKIPAGWIRYPHLPPRVEGPGKNRIKKIRSNTLGILIYHQVNGEQI